MSMKTIKTLATLVLAILCLCPFLAKAQIDTAWVTNEHASQYIFPPIIDEVNYNNQPNTERVYNAGFIQSMQRNDNSSPFGFAQKYEVQDADTLMGIAFVIGYLSSSGGVFDTITISILDGRFTELYSESFYICDSSSDGDYMGKYAEYMFDEQITLYEDYYIAIEFSARCYLNFSTDIGFMTLEEYVCNTHTGVNMDRCTPYGISTKYRPYVKFCSDGNWIHVNDVEWGFRSYENTAIYQNYPTLTCDTVVCIPIGLCPIRALENSTSTDDDSISTGGGDSYIATVLADEDIELYPNPADEVLNIRSDYNITSIEVIDAMNRVIERWELNTRELTLDVASYKSGTYFIIIKTDKGSLTKKFIVR